MREKKFQMTESKNIEFYQDEDGKLKLNVQVEDETVWLSQGQMVDLFKRDKRTISHHISSIYKEEELEKHPTVRKYRTVQKEGSRSVEREQDFYNLDVIISVGYRVKSKRGTQFRKWASGILKDHLIKGYTLNEKKLKQQGKDFQEIASLAGKTFEKHDLGSPEAIEMFSIIKKYAGSFTLLQKYDEDGLKEPLGNKPSQELTIEVARELIADLKQNLIKKGEATPLFGNEKDNSFEALIGNIEQTFGGQYLYETIEKKAAHLLYFMVKDHPFTDGNKRSAAYIFLAYLAKNELLYKGGSSSINESGLVAITLLIAESDPKQKELMVKLVQNLL
jgi:prophage maintenance system killer protein